MPLKWRLFMVKESKDISTQSTTTHLHNSHAKNVCNIHQVSYSAELGPWLPSSGCGCFLLLCAYLAWICLIVQSFLFLSLVKLLSCSKVGAAWGSWLLVVVLLDAWVFFFCFQLPCVLGCRFFSFPWMWDFIFYFLAWPKLWVSFLVAIFGRLACYVSSLL